MVSFVGADSGGGNVANINTAANPVTWPAGIQSGDTAIVLWIMQNTVTPTIPSGFTVPTGGAFDGSTGSARYRFMWRTCDGSESGNLSLTNSTAGGTANRQSAVLIVYRGLNAANPIDGTPQTRDETSSGTTHASPSVTTGVANAVVWVGVGERATTGTNAWTPPSSPFNNERADSDGAATGSGGTIVAGGDDGLAVSRASGTVVTPGSWTSGNAFASANVVTWTVSLKPGAQSAAANTAGETDAAQPLAKGKRRAAAQASSTETAQAVGRRKTRTAVTATTVDAAQAAGRRKTRTAAPASATETAQALGKAKRLTAGPAATVDAAQPIGRRKALAVPTAAETATARSVGDLHAVQGAGEADEARPLARGKRAALTAAQGTAEARIVARRKTRAIGTASTTHAAQPLSAAKTSALGPATDISSAEPITQPGAITEPVSPAGELAQALPIGKTKHLALQPAVEQAAARTLGRVRLIPLGPPTEMAASGALGRGKTLALGTAEETDAAVPVSGGEQPGTLPDLTGTLAPTGRLTGALEAVPAYAGALAPDEPYAGALDATDGRTGTLTATATLTGTIA